VVTDNTENVQQRVVCFRGFSRTLTRMMCDRLPADVLRIRFTINEQFTEMSSRSVSVLTSAMKKFIVNVGTNDVSAKMSTSHQ